MQINANRQTLDHESYRMAHGSRSLLPYCSSSTGKVFIVKDDSLSQVTLISVSDDQEITISPSEFSAGYKGAFLDESVFLFGSKAQIASANAFYKSVDEAVQRCVYGKANLPVVV